MSLSTRRFITASAAVFITFLVIRALFYPSENFFFPSSSHIKDASTTKKPKFKWADYKQKNPVTSMIPLPTGLPQQLPKIQHDFAETDPKRLELNRERIAAVRANFTHAWQGYKRYAYLKDELRPMTALFNGDAFGGWAATLVDTLGFLWILGMRDDFEEAVNALDKIDFSRCAIPNLSIFETTIRYMGGFLSAYDLSDHQYPALLDKAIELGEMLYVAFDTPNRMPVLHWDFQNAMDGFSQTASTDAVVAELGSLSLELTRLTQVTGDPKYYDAVARVMNVFDEQQNKTKLPGLWPMIVNARDLDFTLGDFFTLGGLVDSLYEYLPKQYMLLGGASPQYKKLYQDAIKPIKKHMFFRPMVPGADILFAGQMAVDSGKPEDELETEPGAQHLACFVGDMVGLGAKLFNPDDLPVARKLTDGCIWAYENFPLGIMPEILHFAKCNDEKHCPFDEAKWHEGVRDVWMVSEAQEIIDNNNLPKGVTRVDDTRYMLRPEAIESAFYMYRITGDDKYQDHAWNMFTAIVHVTKTSFAHASIKDCMNPEAPMMEDKMESFWLAETLKYFYLIFEDPNKISLDDWVISTEAHPFKRPSARSSPGAT